MTAPFPLDLDWEALEWASTGAPHLRPILQAVRLGWCGLMLVPQSLEPFTLPAPSRPVIAIVGDDPPEPGRSLGPAGFHLKSVKQLLQSADYLALVTCEALPFIYAAAAVSVVLGPALVGAKPNAIVIESRPSHETAWREIIDGHSTLIPPIIGTVTAGGRP